MRRARQVKRSVGALVGAGLLVTVATGCPGDNAGSTSGTTGTTLSGVVTPAAPAPTATTVTDYSTPPPYLVVGTSQGETLAALSVFARSEHAVIEAQGEPNDPFLPELVATHDRKALASRQEIVRQSKEQGEATRFNHVFSVKPLNVTAVSPTEILIVACLTTDYATYRIGTQPDPNQSTDSFRINASVTNVDGHWLLSKRESVQDFEGKTSCEG